MDIGEINKQLKATTRRYETLKEMLLVLVEMKENNYISYDMFNKMYDNTKLLIQRTKFDKLELEKKATL